MIHARVERDSIWCGKRITSVVMTYCRFIHSEILTHRMASRNAASSRAIPWPKMMARIETDPVIPIKWGAEQSGMQTGGEIAEVDKAIAIWLEARDNAVASAKELANLGVHKSIVNRLTEPFMWITVIYTATEWANLFRLRYHPDAEVHFQALAACLYDAISKSEPIERPIHAPFATAEDEDLISKGSDEVRSILLNRVSARCARVSYETHDGIPDPAKDDALAARLMNGSGFGHHSPFEHAAIRASDDKFYGPYDGWRSWRLFKTNENLPGHIDSFKDAVQPLPELGVPK